MLFFNNKNKKANYLIFFFNLKLLSLIKKNENLLEIAFQF